MTHIYVFNRKNENKVFVALFFNPFSFQSQYLRTELTQPSTEYGIKYI